MDKFASFICNLPPEITPSRNVKVAVIDDGIDKLQGEFKDCISEGVSFYNYPYFFSSTGHGTLMAKLVRQVCPKAHLYIARLDQGTFTRQPTAESAIKVRHILAVAYPPSHSLQAIQWAIMMKVDIISMSWTIGQTEMNKSDFKKLEDTIKEANDAKILMFGAASDQGFNNTSISYPAKAPGVFCIGAARLSGQADEYGDKDSHFVFPGGGVGIKSLRHPYGLDSNSDVVLGSSFATAVASGFAAIILHCIEICGLGEHRDDLQNHDVMKDVFGGMTKDSGQSKYIPVQTYFNPELGSSDYDEALEELKKDMERIIRWGFLSLILRRDHEMLISMQAFDRQKDISQTFTVIMIGKLCEHRPPPRFFPVSK
jgi:hypothetical protein